MSGVEIGLGIIIGLAILMAVVFLVTLLIKKTDTKEAGIIKNVYLGRLENSDSFIQDAMKYLKLTNGIKQINGEQINE